MREREKYLLGAFMVSLIVGFTMDSAISNQTLEFINVMVPQEFVVPSIFLVLAGYLLLSYSINQIRLMFQSPASRQVDYGEIGHKVAFYAILPVLPITFSMLCGSIGFFLVTFTLSVTLSLVLSFNQSKVALYEQPNLLVEDKESLSHMVGYMSLSCTLVVMILSACSLIIFLDAF